MGKIVVLTIFILFVCFWEIDGRPQQTKPGCWYEGKRYHEDQVINTTEPCLRCRCNDGSLRCRLRICPRLPSPTPFGCTTRTPRDNVCCSELVCGDSHERNVSVKRDPAKEPRHQEDGCLHEGVRYGPGSAMMGSRRCEYCYCISGSRRCLRPRCLLPLAGCIPLYAPYSCCPVAYNCNNSDYHSFSSVGSSSSLSRNGCRIGNRSYDEGEMVRDIGWKGTCDNCFCAMGGVRCVPLSCAPPLQGCTPIVREGQCCPSTYNCSGTIEVKATQNYASYAFISKDYAKFRKETNFFSIDDDSDDDDDDHEIYETIGNSTVEGRGHKNPQQPSQSTSTGTKTFHDTATLKTTSDASMIIDHDETTSVRKNFTTTMENTTERLTMISGQDNETMDNEIPTEALSIEKFSTQQDTKFSTSSMSNETTEMPSMTPESITNYDLAASSTISTNEEIYDFTSSIVYHQDYADTSLMPLEITTIRSDDETIMDYSTIDDHTTMIYDDRSSLLEIEDAKTKRVEEKESTRRIIESTTKFLKINDTKGENKNMEKNTFFGIGESSVISIKGPATGSPTTILMPDSMFVINVTLRTNVSVGHVQGVTINPVRSIEPDIESIINITNRKKGEDYDYDYSQPTLPPSLPNVRIIPFVAADALVKQGEEVSSQVTNYPLESVGLSPQELGPTVASGTAENFYDLVTQKNRFSPPIETEGGFVPREPSYYDSPYRSTDHNLDVHTVVTAVPADITNSHRKNDELAGICVFENRNYRHGDILPSSGHCIICICYYGEVACSDEKCPPLKIGCSRLVNEKICCGKIICVDAEESPTLVLDRADAIAPSPREPLPSLDGMVSPDPFRDVIKTKPAPDLPSLIEDMIPYFVEHRIAKPTTSGITTPMTNLEPSIHGHYRHPAEHKVTQDSTNTRNCSSMNDALEESTNSSKTMSKVEIPITRTAEIVKSIVNTDEGNETSALTGATGASSNRPEGIQVQQENDESSIFSFDSVFDLLFSDKSNTGAMVETSDSVDKTTTKVAVPSNTTADGLLQPDLERFPDHHRLKDEEPLDVATDSSTTIATRLSTATSNTSSTVDIEVPVNRTTVMKIPAIEATWTTNDSRPTTSGPSDNEIQTSVGGLLKLAGCNIYGRMYRVGEIITELSSPCLECRCTEVGVQCKQLEC